MRTFWIILALIALAIGGGWYYEHTHPDRVAVRVVTVDRGRVEATVSNTRAGTVKACRRTRLSPVIGGRVVTVAHPEGSTVHQGEVLLTLDPTDTKAEIGHIKAQIVSARDQAQATCLRADYMSRTLKRKQAIHPEAISRDAYDKVETETHIAHAECQAARSAVTVAEAALTVAQKQLSHTRLTAPFDGVLAKINAKVGEYIAPSPPHAPSAPIIDLIAPGCFVVSVPIDEVDAARVAVGMSAQVTLDAWRGTPFAARVIRTGRYVVDRQKQSRTVEVELALSDRTLTQKLLAGYSADATIVVETRPDTLRIPTDALVDASHVFLFDTRDGTLHKRTVTKGIGNWNFTEVTQGLSPGDKVVISLGEKGVKEGAYAQIADPASAEGPSAKSTP